MTRITVDSELRSKLLDLNEPLDLYDESGRIVGMFMPIGVAPPPGYSEPPLSEEEWKRRKRAGGRPKCAGGTPDGRRNQRQQPAGQAGGMALIGAAPRIHYCAIDEDCNQGERRP